jgi:hypothetical protein
MAINPIGATGPTQFSGAGMGASGASFEKSLRAASPTPMPGENASMAVVKPSANEATSVQHASSAKCRLGAAKPNAEVTATRVMDQVNRAQSRMESILKLAESGKSFSPAELLSLQTHVYRASQELDLAGKVVEKATGGLKQVLQTQV